jgi:GNAT superfamily N-acetyltransferase
MDIVRTKQLIKMYQPKTILFEHLGYTITSDKLQLQPEAVHQWLSTESYWAKGIPYERVARAIEHSFCVGALWEGRQVGFARLITDYASFGYLADVYVEEAHRRKGLAKAICKAIIEQDWAKELRRVMLATRDAHEVYAALGFSVTERPERLMEILQIDPYTQ